MTRAASSRSASALLLLAAAVWLWARRRPAPAAPIASVTTGSTIDLDPIGGATEYSYAIRTVADAIARAEGFYAAGATVPKRAHNPGNLVLGDRGLGTLGAGITVFESDALGWAALYRQLALIVSGRSSVYTLDFSIADMARRWTVTQAGAWAANVAGFLGVSVDTPLVDLLV